jgi:VWFA-related protein
MKRSNNFLLLCTLLLTFAGLLGGCGGSSGGGDTNNVIETGDLQLSKSSYNFGDVTLGNTATLSVIINNTGTGNVVITELTLSDNTNFAIDSSECGSGPYTIAAGMSCSIIVTFSPKDEGSYSEMLTITSNDADTPAAAVTLTGEGTRISAYSVALNQLVTDCATDTVTAYISVTDQDGFAVTDLAADDFSIKENDVDSIVPDPVYFAKDASLPLSIAILMDHSGSVYEVPNLLESIENSISGFVEDKGALDQIEIIKFASLVQRTQDFTTDIDSLNLAIYQDPGNLGYYTALYDAIYQGIEDCYTADPDRRAVLVLTDGSNTSPESAYTIEEVIGRGKDLGVPVFTMSIGTNTAAGLLENIATETGGIFFDSPDTDRLQTIYTQLSKILKNQYVLTYTSPGTGAPDNTVVVRLQHAPAGGGMISDDSNPLTYTCP